MDLVQDPEPDQLVRCHHWVYGYILFSIRKINVKIL